MLEEVSMDVGGMKIDSRDILTDDLICKIKNLNPALGTPDDPEYERYRKYRDEFENAELIVIDAQALNKSSITSLDLSGTTADVEALPSNYFQLIDNSLDIAFGFDDFDFYNTPVNSNVGFEDFAEFGDTDFSPFSSGSY